MTTRTFDVVTQETASLTLRIEGGTQERASCELEDSIVTLKKPRSYRPENSEFSLMNRRHCPKEESMVAVNKRLLLIHKIRGWSTESRLPVLQKHLSHSKHVLIVLQNIRFLHAQNNPCAPVESKVALMKLPP
jgi:hypothetical protein